MKLVVRMDSHIGWNFVTWYIWMITVSIIVHWNDVVPIDDVLGFDLPQFLLPISSKGAGHLTPLPSI